MSVETGKQQEGLLKAAEAGEQQGKLLNAARAGDLDIVHKIIQEDAVDINYSSSIYNDKTSLGKCSFFVHDFKRSKFLPEGCILQLRSIILTDRFPHSCTFSWSVTSAACHT